MTEMPIRRKKDPKPPEPLPPICESCGLPMLRHCPPPKGYCGWWFCLDCKYVWDPALNLRYPPRG